MFMPRFDANTEKRYRASIYESDIIILKRTLILCVIFYAAYFLVDSFLYYNGELSRNDWLLFSKIRFVFVIPFMIFNYVVLYINKLKKYYQFITMLDYTFAGIGIVYMLVEVPKNFAYYGGMFLIFAVGFFLTRLFIEYTTLGTLLIIVSYNIILHDHGASWQKSLIYTSFYVGFAIVCIYGSINSERYRRELFSQAESLRGDKVILERHLYENLLDVENANRITIFSLARLAESRDKYTGDHIERVGSLCLELAEKVPDSYYYMNGENKASIIKSIELASTLHDIGKVAIPESILMKPGKLTLEEKEVMKTHSVIGSDTLSQIREKYSKNDFVNMGVEICLSHHERWDGTGYPDGLKEQSIPMSARIVSIIDVFDALISERPYKKSMSVKEAVDEMKEASSSQFDPTLLAIFLDYIQNKYAD